MPLVTIGMPVYNGSASLESSIESILSQSYQNLEIIISDNNSEDSSMEICRKYALLDQRITVKLWEDGFVAERKMEKKCHHCFVLYIMSNLDIFLDHIHC